MTRLLVWNFELLGFNNPLWRGNPGVGPHHHRLGGQLRISMGSKKNLLRYMDANGIDRCVIHPIAPFATPGRTWNCAPASRASSPSPAPTLSGLGKGDQGGHGGRLQGAEGPPILQRLAPEDPFYFDLLEAFAPYGKPVMIHAGEFDYYIVKDGYASYGDTLRFEKLIAAFPRYPSSSAYGPVLSGKGARTGPPLRPCLPGDVLSTRA